MNDNQPSNQDPLEEAIRAFQAMAVGERPADAELLARFGTRRGNVSQRPCISIPSKRRNLMLLLVPAAAAAVLFIGGLALYLRNNSPPESAQVAATDSSDKSQDVAVAPPQQAAEPQAAEKLEAEGPAGPMPVPINDQPLQGGGGNLTEKQSVPPLEERVAESQVIVVATGLDSIPAPPEVPGDSPEVLIRWQVKRVLKGELGKKEFTTRTSTPAIEFIGKEWIIFLTPDYMAGKHQYAACLHIKFEQAVKPNALNKEIELLRGKWSFNGEVQLAIYGDESFEINIAGNRINGVRKIDPTKKPKEITLTPDNSKKPLYGVYELKGDTLTLCIGEKRPTQFNAEEGAMLWVLKREKEDTDLIQGAWKCVSLEAKGKVNKGPFIGEKWVFKGKEVIVYHEDKVRAQGTFVLDPEKKPKTITITGTDGDLQGKTVLGIYRIEKNSLTLCNSLDQRPKEFSGAGKPVLLTFERMKSE